MKTIKQTKTLRIRNILHSYDALYREIDEYNTTYWSQFLFSVWLFFGVFLVIAISLLFFNLPIVMKIMIFIVIFTLIILYIYIMTIASSVNSEANKSYLIFNSFIVNYCKTGKIGYRQYLFDNCKVNLSIFLDENYLFRTI